MGGTWLGIFISRCSQTGRKEHAIMREQRGRFETLRCETAEKERDDVGALGELRSLRCMIAVAVVGS